MSLASGLLKDKTRSARGRRGTNPSDGSGRGVGSSEGEGRALERREGGVSTLRAAGVRCR